MWQPSRRAKTPASVRSAAWAAQAGRIRAQPVSVLRFSSLWRFAKRLQSLSRWVAEWFKAPVLKAAYVLPAGDPQVAFFHCLFGTDSGWSETSYPPVARQMGIDALRSEIWRPAGCRFAAARRQGRNLGVAAATGFSAKAGYWPSCRCEDEAEDVHRFATEWGLAGWLRLSGKGRFFRA